MTQQGSEIAEQFKRVLNFLHTPSSEFWPLSNVPQSHAPGVGSPKLGMAWTAPSLSFLTFTLHPSCEPSYAARVCDRWALAPVQPTAKALVRGEGLPTTHLAWTPVPPADHYAFISGLGRGRKNGEEKGIPRHQSRGCIPKRAGRCSSTCLEDQATQWAVALVQAENFIRVVSKIQRYTLTACMNRAEGKGDCKK